LQHHLVAIIIELDPLAPVFDNGSLLSGLLLFLALFAAAAHHEESRQKHRSPSSDVRDSGKHGRVIVIVGLLFLLLLLRFLLFWFFLFRFFRCGLRSRGLFRDLNRNLNQFTESAAPIDRINQFKRCLAFHLFAFLYARSTAPVHSADFVKLFGIAIHDFALVTFFLVLLPAPVRHAPGAAATLVASNTDLVPFAVLWCMIADAFSSTSMGVRTDKMLVDGTLFVLSANTSTSTSRVFSVIVMTRAACRGEKSSEGVTNQLFGIFAMRGFFQALASPGATVLVSDEMLSFIADWGLDIAHTMLIATVLATFEMLSGRADGGWVFAFTAF